MCSAAGWSPWTGKIAIFVAALSFVATAGVIGCRGAIADDEARQSGGPDEPAEDDAASPYQPGLIARFVGGDGVEHARLEERLAFHRGRRSPDGRIATGPFVARFSGRLQAQVPGTYRLSVFAAGKVRLELAGRLLLDTASREPAWLDAEPIELDFGYHPLEVRYERGDGDAQISLYWQGPQFQLEPVATRWLFHESTDTPGDTFEHGGRLVRALRCAACHDLPGEPAALPAPALAQLTCNLSRAWLVDWLCQATSADDADAPQGRARRMPHFGFDREQASAAADFLFSVSKPLVPAMARPALPEAQPNKKKKKGEADEPAPQPPNAQAGATLFRSVGCLACHRAGGLGSDGLFGGGDLSRIAEKRPADFFARWLKEPEGINRDHRMPTFPLSLDDADSLALYLQTLKSNDSPRETAAKADIVRGRQLVEQARCIQCHAVAESAGLAATPKRRKLEAAKLAGTETCLDRPDAKTHRPGYRLTGDDRQAVLSYLAATLRTPPLAAPVSGSDLLAERNCLACHARGQGRGLTLRLPAAAEQDASLRDMLPALVPPALDGVGDKLHDRALEEAITVAHAPNQPWLMVRMPKFKFQPREAAEIAKYFIDTDRIPPRPATDRPAPPLQTAATLEAAGARLVTADGFGCTSCHAIGKWQPQKVALNARGANLSSIGTSIRHEWFERWVRNPARMVPQMEMPAIVQPVRGVLDGNLESQLAALWHVLNHGDFTPPAPGALRVVRRSNLPGPVERAIVLTDVIEIGGRPWVKPLVIGLSNRHNVLYDLASARLAAWWVGDTARQQTRGKSWHWEAGGTQLLNRENRARGKTAPPGPSEWSLLTGGGPISPRLDGQYVTTFDRIEHIADGGARFAYRLHFDVDGQQHVLSVVQDFLPLTSQENAKMSGFRRRVELDHVPDGAKAELLVLIGDVQPTEDGGFAIVEGSTRLEVTAHLPSGAKLVKNPRGTCVVFAASVRPLACELEYRAEATVDQFPPLPMIDRDVPRQELAVVPGFEAVRLPVTDQAMPTGLAWRPDGTLVVSSLEGRVWLGRDTDGDGLEDKLEPFSDELAAPFGVAASGNAIDAIAKYGLVRMWDDDGDGQADRTELVADGWPHTLDYHDWAVGLPRDLAGNYYVSLPCQQDDRSEAAARLRGTVIKLVPRATTEDDPRRYAIEPLSSGLRFPQGVALSPAGDLFVTDNQGNYTPFNELNEIVQGARYGFVNRIDSKRTFDTPVHTAAVEIPHPWTRSVNGICFLTPPSTGNEPTGHGLFGPLAGQLVGCEYDTRRLVRMSLQRVAGEFQGAVYPLSVEPAAGQETFEGPLTCQVSPSGDLYVGNIRDSGWGAGSNTGSLVRLRWRGDLPPGIAEVRAAKNGFSIRFTTPIDRAQAAKAANYSVSSYRRIATPAYGGPDQDRRVEKIVAVRVSDDARQADVELESLREGFVYEFHLRDLASQGRFFPAEAYYTLRHRVE